MIRYVHAVFAEGVTTPRAAANSHTTPKRYVFKTNDETIEVGNMVVVETQFGLQIVHVGEITEASDTRATKWVVQKVDLTAHEERKNREKQVALVKAKMDAIREQAQELEVYRILAEKDPEMAKLLEQLEALQG